MKCDKVVINSAKVKVVIQRSGERKKMAYLIKEYE